MIMIEALMAILIFALGVLGMVGVNYVASTNQSDAQYRSEANRMASELVNQIWVSVDRTNEANLVASLNAFKHREDVAACDTTSAGTASVSPIVTAWIGDITGVTRGLPGSTNKMQQIRVGADHQVTVTVCWKAPSDMWVRQHIFTSYVN